MDLARSGPLETPCPGSGQTLRRVSPPGSAAASNPATPAACRPQTQLPSASCSTQLPVGIRPGYPISGAALESRAFPARIPEECLNTIRNAQTVACQGDRSRLGPRPAGKCRPARPWDTPTGLWRSRIVGLNLELRVAGRPLSPAARPPHALFAEVPEHPEHEGDGQGRRNEIGKSDKQAAHGDAPAPLSALHHARVATASERKALHNQKTTEALRIE